MPIRIIEAQRLYRQIAEQLRDLIMRNEFGPGSRLPPERDLAVQLGVSRPSVREALIALEVEGWIEVRKGAGIYVSLQRPPRPMQKENLVDAPGPFELIRARSVVEGEVAAQAARMARKSQLVALESALQQMQMQADAGEVPLQADRSFHLQLAQITGNTVLVMLVTSLFDHRSGPMSTTLGQHVEDLEAWNAAIEEHRGVIVSIAAHDEEGARAAMHRHMERSHSRLLNSPLGAA